EVRVGELQQLCRHTRPERLAGKAVQRPSHAVERGRQDRGKASQVALVQLAWFDDLDVGGRYGLGEVTARLARQGFLTEVAALLDVAQGDAGAVVIHCVQADETVHESVQML